MNATKSISVEIGSTAADPRLLESLKGDLFGRASAEIFRIRFFASLLAVDCLCIVAGFFLAGVFWLGSPFDVHVLRTLAVLLPTFIAVALNNQSYSVEALQRPSFGIGRAVKAFLYACAITIALIFYLKISTDFSRIIFALGSVLSLAGISGMRWAFGNYLGKKRHWTFSSRLVILDDVEVSPQRGDRIILASELGINPGEANPANRDRISELVGRFDSIVIACPPGRRREWIYSFHGCSVDVEVLMPELLRLGAIELRTAHGQQSLVVNSRPLGVRDRALKRSLDLMVAGSALVFLAPLMVLLALAIKIESKGSVLFRQRRVGQNNRIFNVLKFRSMRSEYSDPRGIRSADPLDERVTVVGRFMRRTSLDELPQLLNVLSGEMSIVGPRPHALGSTAQNALFWEVERRYFQRHSIKPGMTGLAQVRGYRGATLRRSDVRNRVRSDLEYLSGWTIWRDLKILAATFLVLVHPKAF